MTERTFRSPSPNRPASAAAMQDYPPPVPPVPQSYVSPQPLQTRSDKKPGQRAVSLEPPPKVMSPTMRGPGGRGRGDSLDRRTGQPPPKARAPQSTSLDNFSELDRGDSNGSRNFSYPMRPNSPPAAKAAALASRKPPQQQQNGISPAQAEQIRQEVFQSAQQPIIKKKKKVAPGAAEGSHLSSGTMGVRANVSAEQITSSPNQQQATPSPGPQPVKRKKKKVVTPTDSPVVAAQSRPFSPGFSSDDDSTPEKAERKKQRASGILNKQPSVVREDWEGENEGAPVQITPSAKAQPENGMSPVGPTPAVTGKKVSTEANMSRKIDEPVIEQPQTVRQPLPSFAPTLSVAVPSPTSDMLGTSGPQTSSKGYLDVLRSSSQEQGTRQASLSPSRSKTRFSRNLLTDMSAERKHEPLPRSVSPAKSAMKHHSPSPSGVSPVEAMMPGQWKRSSQTPSEASFDDTTSMASTDNLAPAVPKKKKSARVSFEESPEVVGTSQSVGPNTPVLASPQHKEIAKKGWFGLGKAKLSPLGTIPAEDDMEEVMKPRPMLPSFASARKNQRTDVPAQRATSATHAAVTMPTADNSSRQPRIESSDVSTDSNAATMDTSISSDHAIGGLLMQEKSAVSANHTGAYQATTLPLPPEVTSKEESGYASDSSASIYSREENATPTTKDVAPESRAAEAKEGPGLNASAESPTVPDTAAPNTAGVESSEPVNVPSIAFQPPTPGLEQTASQDDMFVSLPGGFPSSAEVLSSVPADIPTVSQVISDPSLVPSSSASAQIISDPALVPASTAAPTGLGIADVSKEASPSASRQAQTAESFSAALRQRDLPDAGEESDSGDSIYSDAEEAHKEGDGFGSINAIVESPVHPSPAARIVTPPDSPTTRTGPLQSGKPAAADRTESWDQAQARWREIAELQKQQIERPPDQAQTLESTTDFAQPPKPKTKKKKKKLNIQEGEIAPSVIATMESPARASSQTSPYPIIPAGRGASTGPSTMRHSMQPQPTDEGPQYRGSMRPTSMPPQQQQGTLGATAKRKGALQKKHIPAAGASGLSAADEVDAGAYQRPSKTTSMTATQPKPAPAPLSAPKPRRSALQRTFSNDNDSSSSFKKRRKQRASQDGSFSMRRSMRGEEGGTRVSQSQAVPAGRGRGGVRSASPVERRPFSPVAGKSTFRSSMRGPVDSGAPTLRNKEGHKRASSAFAGFGKSKSKAMSSKTAPASRMPKMSSRFADSDDEDGPGPATFRSRFVDSSDEEPERTKFRPVRGIPRKTDEGDSTDLEDSDDAEKDIEKRKTSAPAVVAPTNGNKTTFADAPQSPNAEKKGGFFGRWRSKKIKDDKGKTSKLPFESQDSRQAYIEQVKTEMEKNDKPEEQSPVPARPGILQRRSTPQRVMSDSFTSRRMPSESWPLPPKIGEDRPFSSDGVPNAADSTVAGGENRPGVLERQNTSSTVRTANGTPIYSERTGKKKKFPMLRRAFGLYD